MSAKDPNKPKKVKPVFAKPEPASTETLSSVLNIHCYKTGAPIVVNEYLKVYDPADGKLLGVGRFTFDSARRCFSFVPNQGMSNLVGVSLFENFQDIKMVFCCNLEKLTLDELNEIVMPNL